MKSLLFVCGLLAACHALAQPAPPMAARPEALRVGIPVNYDQSRVGDWRATLPDLLTMRDGRAVTTPEGWRTERRPEILRLFETYQFGKWPAEKPPLRYDVVPAERGKRVTIYFSPSDTTHKVEVRVFLPEDAAEKPAPLLLNLSFMSNEVTAERMASTIDDFLAAGFGFATLRYADIEPDRPDGVLTGVRGLYVPSTEKPLYPAPDAWGAISAWAWGVSQVIDYFETDPQIDARRIALTGASRLGKTTLWTAAKDERIAVVLASCSGEGGAALSRRNYGETIAHMSHPTRYWYQFAVNWAQFGPDPSRSPVDAHMLVSLIAPRPLLLQTGTTDYWSDPVGEFEAAVEAGKVYRLLGKDDLGTTTLPTPDSPIYHTLGYFMHEGGHGTIPLDWEIYLEYLKKYL